MFGLPGGSEWILILIVFLPMIFWLVVQINCVIKAFKAFKVLEETKRDVQNIYNLLKEKEKS